MYHNIHYKYYTYTLTEPHHWHSAQKVITITTTSASFFCSKIGRNGGSNYLDNGWWSASLVPKRRGINKHMLLVNILWKKSTKVTTTASLY